MRKNLIIWFGIAAAVLGVVLILSGCSTPDDERGDAGKVIGREESHWTTKSGKTIVWHHDYDLTVRRPDGTVYELDVSEDGHDHCYRGSSYPRCVDR